MLSLPFLWESSPLGNIKKPTSQEVGFSLTEGYCCWFLSIKIRICNCHSLDIGHSSFTEQFAIFVLHYAVEWKA